MGFVENVNILVNSSVDLSTVGDNIGSINTVGNNIATIKIVGDNIDIIGNVSTNLIPVLDSVIDVANNIDTIEVIKNNIDVVTRLDVDAVTVSYGAEADANLIGNKLILEIPKGVPGVAGQDGMTPQYEFSYDAETGYLQYYLTGYIPSTDIESEEW